LHFKNRARLSTVQILLATLCDFAADYQGKLCILGAFDTLCTREFPVHHPQCSFALRLFFDHEDSGTYNMKIRALGPEDEDIMPPFPADIDATIPPGGPPFISRNIVLNLQRMKFEKPGLYRFVVEHDDIELTSVPLRVMLYEDPHRSTSPFG
jgi:hypothetical protein